MALKIPKHVYSLLIEHANYDKGLVERAIKLAEANNDKVTPQKILNEIWAVMDTEIQPNS